jgi:hypothetical protein
MPNNSHALRAIFLAAKTKCGGLQQLAARIGLSVKQVRRYLSARETGANPRREVKWQLLRLLERSSESAKLNDAELAKDWQRAIHEFGTTATPAAEARHNGASLQPIISESELAVAMHRHSNAAMAVVILAHDYSRMSQDDGISHARRLAAAVRPEQTIVLAHPSPTFTVYGKRSRPREYYTAVESTLRTLRQTSRTVRYMFDVGMAGFAPVVGAYFLIVDKNAHDVLEVVAMFQEVQCPGGDAGWLQFNGETLKRVGEALMSSIVPIKNPPMGVAEREKEHEYWRLDPGDFRAVQHILGYSESAESLMPPKVLQALRNQSKSRVRVLEIGGRDLGASKHLFYDAIEKSGRKVQLVALEPAAPRCDDSFAKQAMEDLRGVFVLEDPHEFVPNKSDVFDLILVNHRIYFSSPELLVKLMLLLAPGGHMLILHSPREGNVFSKLCELTAGLLPHIKKLQGDEHRTYAEDLIDFATQHAIPCEVKSLHVSIPVSRLLDGDDIHQDIDTAISHFLLGNKNWQKSSFFREKVLTYLRSLRTGAKTARNSDIVERVVNNENLLILSRPQRLGWAEIHAQATAAPAIVRATVESSTANLEWAAPRPPIENGT